jgi:hypothetical protein
MAYTPEQLAIVCPHCSAASGAKCLEKKKDGSSWIEQPHPERKEAAERRESNVLGP